MNAKLALKGLVAFALALLAGRIVFTQQPVVKPVAQPVLGVQPAVAAPKSPDLSWLPRSKFVSQTANIDFKPVPHGLENDNGRMVTTVSDIYTGGMTHKTPRNFDSSAAYTPLSQEVRNGAEVVSVSAFANASKAYVLNRDGQKQVIYPSTYSNTDDRLYMRADGGMEHDIILKRLPVLNSTHSLAFTGTLKLSHDLTIWDGPTQITGSHSTRNGLDFKNSFGNTVFYLRPAFAYDANVTRPEGGLDETKQSMPQNQNNVTRCEYQLSIDESGIKLAVVTPGAWLNNPERAYPVVIDPNFGPFGLADGNPPFYTGSVGSDTFIPLHNGANGQGSTKVPVANNCGILGLPETNWGTVTVPFPFTYYPGSGGAVSGVHPTGSPLFVHEVGFASWIMPDPPPFPLFTQAPCFDLPQTTLPAGSYPNDAFYPYWDDLTFSADPLSGIYTLFDNTAGVGSGRLIIEWYRMSYAQGGTSGELISFNLILYECNSIIEFIIKNPGQMEKDRGMAAVGIENAAGSTGIQYCFNAAAQGLPEIPDSTALTFSVSPLSNLTVQATNLQGCKPLTACYTSSIKITLPPCALAGGGSSIPASFGFHWDFGDGGQAFTNNVCHTFIAPGSFPVTLTVTDTVGNRATFTNGLAVTVCDVPPVVITADPQGGTAPLTVNVVAKSVSPVGLINGQLTQTISLNNTLTVINVEQQGTQNEPFVFVPYQAFNSDTATVLFDHPGTYRIQASFSGTSVGLPTTGTGTIFITVLDPNAAIFNSLIITQSDFTINWAGKLPNQEGVPPQPASDTISVKGLVNLQGLDLSSLAGQEVTLALNAYAPIFQGTLGTNGIAQQGDFTTGKTGTFVLTPSGQFVCTVKGDYAFALGLTSLTEHRFLTAHYRLQIGTVFNSPGTTISYDYKSNANKKASGHYKFGRFAKYGTIPGAPGGFGEPGGQEVLLSGGFLVTRADFKLQGDTVTATISGLLARAGGDDLRPAATSDVVVKIGNYTETLNFSTTPKFKTTGRPPAQHFSFRSGGGTNIKSLGWANKAGNFQITTFTALPNSQVGINPTLGRQPITVTFIVSPENGQQYIGTTTFDIFKVSDTEFKH